YQLVGSEISLDQWRKFRLEVEKDHYGQSADVFRIWRSNEGPYAFQFADTALMPEGIGHHDYLAKSELADFILSCLERKLNCRLQDRFRSVSKPVLVKFVEPGIRAFRLGAALDFLVHRLADW